MRVSPAKMRLRLLNAGYCVEPNPEPRPLPDWLERIFEDSGPEDPNAQFVQFAKEGSYLNLVVVDGQPLQLIGFCDLFEAAELTEGCGDDWKILIRAAE